jgi:hypothetical protein
MVTSLGEITIKRTDDVILITSAVTITHSGSTKNANGTWTSFYHEHGVFCKIKYIWSDNDHDGYMDCFLSIFK